MIGTVEPYPDDVIGKASAGEARRLVAQRREELVAMTDHELSNEVAALRYMHRKQPQIAEGLVDALRQARAMARRMDAEGL